jgi:hypothetical protein
VWVRVETDHWNEDEAKRTRTIVNEQKHNAIRAYYRTLFSAWGCQHWWPAPFRFEMIVGA